jgi:hypothetical protein
MFSSVSAWLIPKEGANIEVFLWKCKINVDLFEVVL